MVLRRPDPFLAKQGDYALLDIGWERAYPVRNLEWEVAQCSYNLTSRGIHISGCVLVSLSRLFRNGSHQFGVSTLPSPCKKLCRGGWEA